MYFMKIRIVLFFLLEINKSCKLLIRAVTKLYYAKIDDFVFFRYIWTF